MENQFENETIFENEVSATEKSKMTTVALILGIVSLIWIPGTCFGLAGLIVSIICLAKKKMPKGKAIAGLILSIVGPILGIIAAVVIALATGLGASLLGTFGLSSLIGANIQDYGFDPDNYVYVPDDTPGIDDDDDYYNNYYDGDDYNNNNYNNDNDDDNDLQSDIDISRYDEYRETYGADMTDEEWEEFVEAYSTIFGGTEYEDWLFGGLEGIGDEGYNDDIDLGVDPDDIESYTGIIGGVMYIVSKDYVLDRGDGTYCVYIKDGTEYEIPGYTYTIDGTTPEQVLKDIERDYGCTNFSEITNYNDEWDYATFDNINQYGQYQFSVAAFSKQTELFVWLIVRPADNEYTSECQDLIDMMKNMHVWDY